MDSRLALETPCKTNLFLSVDGRRPDGYHLISTLFIPLETGPRDLVEISFDAPSGVAFELSGRSELPSGSDNICVKAAKAYCEAAKLAPSFSIKLTKRIPVAAGLGGGSSDAAATLLLLQRRFNALDGVSLRALAAKLGADVPFFLNPVASSARGIGDLLEPLGFAPAPLPLLLVFPRFPTSAAWAYKNLDWNAAKADSRKLDDAVAALRSGELSRIASCARNDLAAAVRRKFPLLGLIESALSARGALVSQVSGSGSSLFALFKDMESRSAAKLSLQAEPGWDAFELY